MGQFGHEFLEFELCGGKLRYLTAQTTKRLNDPKSNPTWPPPPAILGHHPTPRDCARTATLWPSRPRGAPGAQIVGGGREGPCQLATE
jgi:hypothetical protein